MSSLIVRNFTSAHRQLLHRCWVHLGAAGSQGMVIAVPENLEELTAKDKVGFTFERHRDINYSVVQSQMCGVFGSSFMSDQSSCEVASSQDPMLESYSSLSSTMTLNSVTQNSVPSPFSPSSIDRVEAPLNIIPNDCKGYDQKFTASDLQETLYPNEFAHRRNDAINKGNLGLQRCAWSARNLNHLAGINVLRPYSTGVSVPESTKTKLKRAVKDYGATVIVFHVTISIASLSVCYAAVASGLDVPGLMASMGLTSELLNSKLASGASTFLVAYAVHKLFAPVRISITLFSVPFIVRYLRRIGFLKGPPVPPQ